MNYVACKNYASKACDAALACQNYEHVSAPIPEPADKMTGLNFIEAVEAAKSGRTVRRAAWPKKHMIWSVGILIDNSGTIRKEMRLTDEEYLAKDWEIMPDPPQTMKFSKAWKLLKSGKKVKRSYWAGYLTAQQYGLHFVSLFECGPSSGTTVYRLEYDDVEATDWIEVTL